MILLCSVRDCGAPLVRDGRRLVCANGHSFDLARSGYANLLQPQERRSKEPGDSAEAVGARRRVHERGITRPLLEAIASMLTPSRDDVILDAGCGDGWYLGELQREHGFDACGIDISTPAIELAAKRYPDCTWLVANADRFVPVADGSVTKLLSITARMNAPEFARVLCDDGTLLVAVAAPDDLIELRGEGKERVTNAVATFSVEEFRAEGRGPRAEEASAALGVQSSAPGPRHSALSFDLVDQRRSTTIADVDESLVRDLRLSIYRPRGATDLRQVTLSLDLLRFEVRTRAR